MAVLGVRSPADATSSRLEVLRALGSPPAGAPGWSTPASSPAFPRRAARTFEASPLRRDSLGASPPATPAPRPSTAGTTSVADVFARDLIERMDRVEARQREQARELDAERAWARSAVEGLTARIEDSFGRLQTHAAAAQAERDEWSRGIETKLRAVQEEHGKSSSSQHAYFSELFFATQREQEAGRHAGLERQIRDVEEQLRGTAEQMAEQMGDARRRVEETNEKFVDICVGLDDKIGQTREAVEANIAATASRLEQALGALESRTEANDQAVEGRLRDLVEQHSSRCDAEIAQEEERASLALQAASEASAARADELNQELNALDAAVLVIKNELQAQTEAEIADVTSLLERRHAQQTDAHGVLQGQLDRSVSELSAELRDSSGKLGSLLQRADGFALKAETQTQKLIDTMRMDELSEALLQLDQQSEAQLEEMGSQIETFGETMQEFSCAANSPGAAC